MGLAIIQQLESTAHPPHVDVTFHMIFASHSGGFSQVFSDMRVHNLQYCEAVAYHVQTALYRGCMLQVFGLGRDSEELS